MSVISRAEIEAELPRFGTAYDLIHVLRPGMLVTRDAVRQGRSPIRSPSSIPQANQRIRVYLDGLPYGGVETLANIPASTVYGVRWLSALDATTRYGTGNAAGAIMVTTFAGRR